MQISTGISETALQAVVALRTPTKFEVTREKWEEMLHDLASGHLKLETTEGAILTPKPRLTLLERIPKSVLNAIPEHLGPFAKYALTFDVAVPCAAEIDVKPGHGMPTELARSVVRGVAARDVKRWIRQTVFAMNVSTPGAVSISGGVVLSETGVEDLLFRSSADDLWLARDTAAGLGWPTVRELPLLPTWDWLQGQLGFRHGFGGGGIGRALNALGHVAEGRNDSAVQLMWALVGIEALFSTASAGVLAQVRERSRAFLGDAERASKLVSSMYDVRSKFVHGGLDFAGPFGGSGESRAVKIDSEIRAATELGVAILLASIQELIVRGWSDLKFTTRCEPG